MEKRINKIIIIFLVSDFFLHSGWGLIAPIFAIFLTEQIRGGSLEMIGFIAATYWMTKSIAQPFIANALDIEKGEKDDFYVLLFGMCVANLIPLGYFFSSELWHIFLLEFIRGIAMACVVPAWLGLFTKNIKRDWHAFSWSLHSTTIGLGIAFSAAFGGIIASFLGFRAIFILIFILGTISTSILFHVRNKIISKKGFELPPISPL